MLTELKKATIAEMIIDQIIEQLVLGSYKPGDQLPSERVLASNFGVSRASVREAMRALASMGLVEIRPGKGTFLVQNACPVYREELSSKFLIKKRELRDTIEARKVIEVELAKLAAIRGSEEDIDKLKSILMNMRLKIKSRKSFVKDDFNFHLTIAKMAGNSILYETILSIRQLLKMNHIKVVKIKNMDDISYAGHQEIYEAIRDKDPEKAGDVMRKHLEMVERNIDDVEE
ncbi:MAG TPA: FadR/GntR family transcriptional regulator [Sedimentibacter sp.]|jgi:GntR family transcriptional repressor for pyruvate dehydrogenase complex|nr:FadR family transcriptional regulator [Sedimentibacter sp.]HHY99715.1 FadR family transcriptional regulator [Tissierellia bacterium]HOW23399.1 FadR/GntR family transcriptional regulator [Sedimentibacter sp.]HRC81268.1 FadR/GntR family transcriptional regulator [Sedimentibacter sp.]